MSLHVECGLAGAGTHTRAGLPLELAGTLSWTQTLTAGTQSTAVPALPTHAYILTLTAEVDLWFAIGANPVATANPRRRLKAGATRSFCADAGQKVVWSAT